jgi:hypothetical protein
MENQFFRMEFKGTPIINYVARINGNSGIHIHYTVLQCNQKTSIGNSYVCDSNNVLITPLNLSKLEKLVYAVVE